MVPPGVPATYDIIIISACESRKEMDASQQYQEHHPQR